MQYIFLTYRISNLFRSKVPIWTPKIWGSKFDHVQGRPASIYHQTILININDKIRIIYDLLIETAYDSDNHYCSMCNMQIRKRPQWKKKNKAKKNL